jgi:hypothetical protein
VTLEELGDLGEFVAAVATVPTLAYLALQIRATARRPALLRTSAPARPSIN